MQCLNLSQFLKFGCFLFIASVLSLSCSKKEEESPVLDTFQEVVDAGGGFAPPAVETEVSESPSFNQVIDGEDWVCTTETYSIKKGGGGNSGFPLFSPNSSVIYPGNMLQGNSLNQATPNIIAVERAGGNISTDVADGNIQPSFEVEKVSKSEVTNAINAIIDGSTGVVPANFNFSYHNIQSREQFALEVGVDIETAFTELEAHLSFSTENDYNRYYVSLEQSYYTMSYDIPTSLDQLFAPSVTPDDLARYVGDGNPATYISDVTYGRIYYMLIESTSTNTEMQAAIAGSFNGITTDVDGSVEVDYLASLENLKIQVFAYGGLATQSIETIGVTDLGVLVNLLAESSDIRSGKPISYVVRSVYDNQIVSTQLATNYDVTNCLPVTASEIPLTAHWTGSVVSSFGPVGAAFNRYGNELVLINKEGTLFLLSTVGKLEGPFPIDQLGAEPCPLGSIGAACNIDGNLAGEFYLMAWDKTGTKYTWMNGNGYWTDNIKDVTEWAQGTYPYNSTGVGAMAFRSKDPLGPATRYVFNGPGDRFLQFHNNYQGNGAAFLHNLAVWQWGVDNTIPFARIGAGIGLYLGDDLYHILFDEGGTKYTVYGNFDGGGSYFKGPFDL